MLPGFGNQACVMSFGNQKHVTCVEIETPTLGEKCNACVCTNMEGKFVGFKCEGRKT